MSDNMRAATEDETRAYLSGYVGLAGAVETEHGLMVPADEKPYTCGECGRSWLGDTPAGRCPFEYEHKPNETPTCQFGGTCEVDAVYRLTRTDATGWRAMNVCVEHRDPCTESMARYVPGWGHVTFTIDRVWV